MIHLEYDARCGHAWARHKDDFSNLMELAEFIDDLFESLRKKIYLGIIIVRIYEDD